MNKENKFYLEADIKLEESTDELREAASTVINLPDAKDKQPDLQYFSAVFVSSGENLNHAYFMPSELVLAENTIVNKALDIEHQEDQIIGHIYDRAFTTKEGANLELKELADLEKVSLDKKEICINIAGIVYKDRFPNVATEIADNKWKVSMECYFKSFDVKVGNLVISRREAESLGLANTEEGTFGTFAKVIKEGIEVASGELTRVLRGICFSGCGIVKTPADPGAIILETAHVLEKVDDDKTNTIVLNYDETVSGDQEKPLNNLTSTNIDKSVSEVVENKEDSVIEKNDTLGICVNYKRRVYDMTTEEANSKLLHEDWCTLYEQSCTSFSRDTSDPKCLKRQVKSITTASIDKLVVERKLADKRKGLLDKLITSMNTAVGL